MKIMHVQIKERGMIHGFIKKILLILLTSSKSRSAGKTQYEIEGGYIMTTTEETYLFKFSLVTRDDLNEENTGVYRIDILTKELSESDKDWGGNVPDICIYTKEEEQLTMILQMAHCFR